MAKLIDKELNVWQLFDEKGMFLPTDSPTHIFPCWAVFCFCCREFLLGGLLYTIPVRLLFLLGCYYSRVCCVVESTASLL